jgi:prevent-host-death family protein
MAKAKKMPGREWSVSEAKANFAAFLRAAEKGPQIVMVRGVRKAEIRLLPKLRVR